MKVSRLDGVLLDYWVAKSEGLKLLTDQSAEDESRDQGNGFWHPDTYRPSSNWAQGGPIVANEWYDLENVLLEWFGPGWAFVKAITDEPLPWLMRAYVTTKFGEEVEEVIEEIAKVKAVVEKKRSPTAAIASPADQASSHTRKWPSLFGRSRAGKNDSSN